MPPLHDPQGCAVRDSPATDSAPGWAFQLIPSSVLASRTTGSRCAVTSDRTIRRYGSGRNHCGSGRNGRRQAARYGNRGHRTAKQKWFVKSLDRQGTISARNARVAKWPGRVVLRDRQRHLLRRRDQCDQGRNRVDQRLDHRGGSHGDCVAPLPAHPATVGDVRLGPVSARRCQRLANRA
jgi:hypothetical protein